MARTIARIAYQWGPLLAATHSPALWGGPNAAYVESARISIDKHVAAIQPDPATASGMGARFNLGVHVKLQDGVGLAGFRWQNVKGSPVMQSGAIIIDGGATNMYATGYVEGPGVYSTKVGLILQTPGQQPDTEPSVFVWIDCAAIGSFIDFQREKPVGTPSTFEHDLGDVRQPYYMQYFGYTHAQPAPPGFQPTQGLRATVRPQPEGTLVQWSYPNCYSAEALAGAGRPNVETIDLHAESAFLGSLISATFSLTFTDLDGNTYKGSASDDTSSYPRPGGSGASDTRVSKVSGHMPHELILHRMEPFDPGPAGYWRCGSRYWYKLVDTFGQPCPGVWVQERFTSPLPPNFKVNKEKYWVTVMSPAGVFDVSDELRYSWAIQPPEPAPTYSLTHEYFAATTSVDEGGISLGVYQFDLVPGEPGVVTQTRLP